MLSLLLSTTINPGSISWSSYLRTSKGNNNTPDGEGNWNSNFHWTGGEHLISLHMISKTAWNREVCNRCGQREFQNKHLLLAWGVGKQFQLISKVKKHLGDKGRNHLFSTILLLLLFFLIMAAVDFPGDAWDTGSIPDPGKSHGWSN